MEYNTDRQNLKISDYGRNIFKLIEFAKKEPDRTKRTQMATTIVDIMSRYGSDNKRQDNYKRKYWVHLMILADWQLDVDMPYEITPEESVEFSPNRLSYNQGSAHYRHYGAIMENMIKKVSEYPEGEERDELVGLLAHAMKRDYLLWNRDTVEDDLISHQLAAISDDRLAVPADFQYRDYREYLKGTEDERRPNGTRKKKKKKKN